MNLNAISWAKLSTTTLLRFAIHSNKPFVYKRFGFTSCGCDSRRLEKLKQIDVLCMNGESRMSHQRKEGNFDGSTSRKML